MKNDCCIPWIVPVLPTVYGEELSYYECLSKLRKAIADVASNTETLKAQVESMKMYQHKIPVGITVTGNNVTTTEQNAFDIVIISKSAETMDDQSSTDGVISCSIENYNPSKVYIDAYIIIPQYEKADIVEDMLSVLVATEAATTRNQAVYKPSADLTIKFTYGTDVVTAIN